MKSIERITLATTGAATLATVAYFITKAIRSRSARLFLIAAGESPYEHKHSRLYRSKWA